MANLAADADLAATQSAATLQLMGATLIDTLPAALSGLADLQLPMATSFGNPSSKASSRLAADPIYYGDGPPTVHATRLLEQRTQTTCCAIRNGRSIAITTSENYKSQNSTANGMPPSTLRAELTKPRPPTDGNFNHAANTTARSSSTLACSDQWQRHSSSATAAAASGYAAAASGSSARAAAFWFAAGSGDHPLRLPRRARKSLVKISLLAVPLMTTTELC